MASFMEIISNLSSIIPILRTLIIVVVAYILLNLLIRFLRRKLLQRIKTKKHRSDVEIFSRVLNYIVLLILILFAVFSYAGSWTGLGLGIGLFSAALGWALQKPITGMAAWVMVVTKRPFEIGDRIIVGNVKGDVEDITLTHIYLKEIGGIVPSEESSGRIIMVPNSTLFEQNITNYTLQNEYVLDQVITTVTYESNLDNAMKACLQAAKKHTKEFTKETKEEPYIRTFFQPSGIDIRVRYFAPASRLQEVSSNITLETLRRIKKERNVEIAYPHTEVLLRKKKSR